MKWEEEWGFCDKAREELVSERVAREELVSERVESLLVL